MLEDKIIIKGNKSGLNVVIDMNKFRDTEEMTEALIEKLYKGKRFYKGCTLIITTQLEQITEKDMRKLKDLLFEEIFIKDCIFENIEDKKVKIFTGIYEGRTKFIRKTVRSGQCVNYQGNIVIIGDINPGAEVCAAGNVIVLGALRGHVYAGSTGNDKAIIAAFSLQPQLMQIADIMTRSPEDNIEPVYPEVARIKENSIIVEPYLPNKFI